MARKLRQAKIKRIAAERMQILLDEAFRVYRRDIRLASRYVSLAFEISKRSRVRMPKLLKYVLCRKCGSFLVPGLTMSARIVSSPHRYVEIRCLNCGNVRRIPLK